MGRGSSPVRVPAAIWDRADVLEVLARRDIGQLLRTMQAETGATQTQLGTAIGLSQAQVSEVISGGRRITSVDVLARIVRGLDIPEPARTALFLGEAPSGVAAVPAPRRGVREHPRGVDEQRFADVTAVFTSRSAFASAHPVHKLFDDATEIRAVGLSLNLICQQYADTGLYDLARRGSRLRLLLLDPAGAAIKHREREEGYDQDFLSSLTRLNLGVLRRVQDRLPSEYRENLQVAVYDETIRFNIILIDERLGVVQPYLPHSRGLESPTLVVERQDSSPGLHAISERIFTAYWEGARLL